MIFFSLHFTFFLHLMALLTLCKLFLSTVIIKYKHHLFYWSLYLFHNLRELLEKLLLNRYGCRDHTWDTFPSTAPAAQDQVWNTSPLLSLFKLVLFVLYNLFLIRHSYKVAWFMLLGAAKDLSK